MSNKLAFGNAISSGASNVYDYNIPAANNATVSGSNQIMNASSS